MGTVYVFFADGFEEVEAFTSVDVMRRAGLNVEMITVTPDEIVTGAHDVPVLCDKNVVNCDFYDADLVLLPGGMPGAATLEKCPELRKLVLDFAEKNKPIAAICAAPMMLGKLGLLKGRKATCYPGFEQYLEGAECTGAPVERDGKHNGHNRSRRSHQITISGNCTEIREYVVCHKKQDSPGNTS